VTDSGTPEAGGLGSRGPAPAGPLPRPRDVLEGVVIAGAAVGVWVAASALPPAPVEGELSSGGWPQVLAIALGVLGLGVIVQALRGRVKRDESLDPINPAQWPTLAGTLAILVAFLVAWPSVGFLPSAFVAFVLLSRLLGVGNWLRSAAWGVGLALLLWVLFEELLNIPL
jgi:hypothetical protein